MKNKSRREFLILAAVTGASAVVFAACGKSDSNNGGGTPPQQQGVCTDGAATAYINVSHAHTTVAMTGAQIAAAAPGIYTLMGGSHIHTFEFVAQDFVSLKNGDSIQKQDLEGHGHLLEIAC